MGNLSKTKTDLAKCYKLSASEPKTLDEAKKCLDGIKKHAKDAHEMMTNTSKKLQRTVRVLAYDYCHDQETEAGCMLGPGGGVKSVFTRYENFRRIFIQ